MDNIKKDLYKNKKIITICFILIVIVIAFVFIKKLNDNDLNEESNLKNYELLKKYESNQYIPIKVTVEDMAKKYLNDYKNNMLYNIESAYNLLNKEYREKRFKTLDGYKEYINGVISETTYSMQIAKYGTARINGKKIFKIYDESGYLYIIKENSIMDYEVYLDENTVEIK